ncbi:hypothetical protein DRQ50_03450 [bacterium]|nr:MAG: hypothetical protein DRQ50_03450 [bacterium]
MRKHVLLIALATLVAGSAVAEPEMVKNGATPANGVHRLQLEEMWRAGGADDEESFFGLRTWAEEGPDGLLYVLDIQLSQVNVFDENGTLVRTLFREGDGPGEVRRPRDIVLLADGSIGAVQEFPGKIVRVDAENIPLDSIEPRRGDATEGGFIAMTTADQRGGTFMIAGVQITPGENQAIQQRHMYLATVNDEGGVSEPLLERSVVWDFSNFTWDEEESLPSFFWANAVGPAGRIYATPDRDAYRINVYAADGTLERVIEREYESRRRTAADKDWIRNLLESAFAPMPFDVELKISDFDSDIHWLSRSLQVDAGGNLWVLSSRGARDQPAGVLAVYDVFTADGTFDRQVEVACDGDGNEDGVFLLGEDRVLVIKGYIDATATMFGGSPADEEGGDEADPMEIICYRIVN